MYGHKAYADHTEAWEGRRQSNGLLETAPLVRASAHSPATAGLNSRVLSRLQHEGEHVTNSYLSLTKGKEEIKKNTNQKGKRTI